MAPSSRRRRPLDYQNTMWDIEIAAALAVLGAYLPEENGLWEAL